MIPFLFLPLHERLKLAELGSAECLYSSIPILIIKKQCFRILKDFKVPCLGLLLSKKTLCSARLSQILFEDEFRTFYYVIYSISYLN